ncbi:hypothetical protein GOODEAATRI_012199 [Goodea atripinnis]|uniref:Uncharacterized protein n=1 Tax=Goodea atripinnis TaxID=208336 RepID=A0ABV0MRI2_9TELE
MLKSLVAQKEAIVAYAYEYSLLPTLNAHQWTLVENMLTILDACEQLTRNISKVTATTADLSPSIQALMHLRKQSVPTGVKKIKRNPFESNAFGKTFCLYRRRAPVLYGNNTGPKVQG